MWWSENWFVPIDLISIGLHGFLVSLSDILIAPNPNIIRLIYIASRTFSSLISSRKLGAIYLGARRNVFIRGVWSPGCCVGQVLGGAASHVEQPHLVGQVSN